MKFLKILILFFVLLGIVAFQPQNAFAKDGVFIHISHGYDNPHRVLMAMRMAEMMAETKDVLVYLDIKGVEVVLKNSKEMTYSPFPSLHTQIEKLLKKGITIMACPGCLKSAGKTPADLRKGIKVADKNAFFNFTEGRILTLDY
jgi:predicted peroxiredoxin